MRKSLCLLIAIAVMMSCTLNAFAVTELTTSTGMETIRIDGRNGKYFYYDPLTGKVSADSSTTATGLGDLIMPTKENSAYAFTAETNGTVYHYQVLDETVVDGEKQYFIYCNDLYGTNPTAYPTNVFDPDVEGTIANWLNISFLNGEQGDGMVALDENIKGHIVQHDWLVEANKNAPEGYPTTDYSVNCKISLLSITEYAKYAKKIGWGAYVNGTMTSGGIHIFFRSPVGNRTNLRTLYAQSGCTANVASSYATAQIRPAFYISENYFRENKLTGYGNFVSAIIKENNTRDSLKELGYSDEEINGIFTDESLTFDSVTVSGDGLIGSELSVSAVYSDGVEEKCDTSAAIIKWYESATENGEYAKIGGAEGDTYTIGASDSGKYIKASVTPVSLDGSHGIEKISDNAVKAKGHINAVVPSVLTSTTSFYTDDGRISAQSPENEFVSKNDDGEFTYSLLNTDIKDGDVAFLVFSNDNYGDVSTVSEIFHTNNTFNPDDKTNIAHWLNNEFLNGEGSAQNGNKSVFDQTAAQYALVNDWYVEGNGCGENANYKTTSVTQNDYTATCKIALLSYSEYLKYHDKIGYKATSTIASSGDRTLLRSPHTGRAYTMKFFGSGTGSISNQNMANELNSDGSVKNEYSFYFETNPVVIRPVMYLSVDYFKNAKLAKAGENVKKTIRENIPKSELLGLYTEDELVSILGYSSDSTDVSDAVVYGIAAVGETLGVYYDESTLPENAKVTVRWYVSDSADDAGKQEFEGIRCTIPSNYEGKHITAHFDVTDSASGEKLKSEKIYVGKVRSAQSVSAVYTVVDDRNVSFTIKNTSGDDTKTARTIVAAFDENNVMLGIEGKLYSLSAAVTDKITINEVNNAAFYRILILNADDNSPLCTLTLR